MNVLETHPNTSRVVGGGSGAVFVVWFAGHVGVGLSAEDGAIVATSVAAVWVFIGHDGLIGAWRRLMHGAPQP